MGTAWQVGAGARAKRRVFRFMHASLCCSCTAFPFSALSLVPVQAPCAHSAPNVLLPAKLRSRSAPALLQLNDSRFYLKGLAVVDDIAFFGIAPHTQREDRADPTLNCHLAAFDLKVGGQLWGDWPTGLG